MKSENKLKMATVKYPIAAKNTHFQSICLHTRSRKLCICLANEGTGQLRMQLALPSSTLMPLVEILWPRKQISLENSLVFFKLQYSLFSL
jgi:hypothetical protein